MTPDKTPTEALAQLRHLYAQLKSQDGMSRTDRARIADGILSPAIAALEKWGQPAQAAEPFCWHWENTFNGGTGAVKKNPETLGINMSHPDYKWTALYTAQPPTHALAGAVPLTDEQIDQAIAELGLNYLADAHATNRAMLRKLCHHANGIKGGQHVS